KREDFRGFLDGVLADQPPDAEIHVILDNYSPHKRNDDWLAKFEGRVQFHFTPTSASWLNQIEIVFSLLQRKTLNGGSFKSKDQLREAIEAFFRRHNERAKPFRWRKREVRGSQLHNTIVNLRNEGLASLPHTPHGRNSPSLPPLVTDPSFWPVVDGNRSFLRYTCGERGLGFTQLIRPVMRSTSTGSTARSVGASSNRS